MEESLQPQHSQENLTAGVAESFPIAVASSAVLLHTGFLREGLHPTVSPAACAKPNRWAYARDRITSGRREAPGEAMGNCGEHPPRGPRASGSGRWRPSAKDRSVRGRR